MVDTAKLLLNSMPEKARLIVSGIGEEYQDSVVELMDAVEQKERRCIVLFPTDDAKTFEELCRTSSNERTGSEFGTSSAATEAGDDGIIIAPQEEKEMFDVIVMDGTWSQARKIHSRYIPLEKDGGPPRVCLSQEALDILGGTGASANTAENHVVYGVEKGGNGRQLRRHPIKWKEVSTLEATRLLFRDMMSMSGEEHANEDGKQCHDILVEYQRISDSAAIKQLGPPREKQNNLK